jgi:hypothetical protein
MTSFTVRAREVPAKALTVEVTTAAQKSVIFDSDVLNEDRVQEYDKFHVFKTLNGRECNATCFNNYRMSEMLILSMLWIAQIAVNKSALTDNFVKLTRLINTGSFVLQLPLSGISASRYLIWPA